MLAIVGVASPARAVDPFEIQVYDGTANAPHIFGLELHLNHVATGYTTGVAPELPLHGQTHFTLEPSFGVFSWWEVGGYFLTALRPDGHFDYAGVKLRSKFVSPPGFHRYFRLGLNLEVSYLPQTYDRDQWGAEIRPIIAFEADHWLAVVNPIVDLSLAGPDAHLGPLFEPAAKLARSIVEVFALGVEYYGDIGPIASPVPFAAQTHQFFGVVDLEAFHNLELEVGLGSGVTAASAGLVGKVIVGYSFDFKKKDPAAAR